MTTTKKPHRLYSLDVLRGLTVAAMIVVNNGAGNSFSFLEHSEWHGVTICDMVFPSFLFIVGISTYISLSKKNFEFNTATLVKIIRRAISIVLVGWAIQIFGRLCWGTIGNWDTFRFTGVLPRIGLCYLVAGILAIICNRKAIYWIIAALLLIYGIILSVGNGLANDGTSILARFDKAVLGANHLYSRTPVDPEGLLSNISAIAHTLIGFCFGSLIVSKNHSNLESRMLKVMVWGFALLLAGWAVAEIWPLNKRIWSPSYTLFTCGAAAMALGLIAYASDIKGYKKPFQVFDVFGVNPLFLYALSSVVAILFGFWKWNPHIYNFYMGIVQQPQVASLLFALTYAVLMWIIGYPLYKKKIYIKL